MGQSTDTSDPPLRLIAGAAIAAGRIAFALGAPSRWQRIPSYTLVPLELPGGTPPAGMPDTGAAQQALRAVGMAAEIVSSRWTHAPSPAHAIDRHRWEGAEPAPFLELARQQPVDGPDGVALSPAMVRVYRARRRDAFPHATAAVAGAGAGAGAGARPRAGRPARADRARS